MATFGFTGTVDDLTFSRIHALGLPRVAVESPTSWTPSPTGVARQVSFAAGNGRILGLRDERAGAFTVANASHPGGADRYDIIVMRADFTAKTVTPTAITGTVGAGIPPAITKTVLGVGAVYDFPLVVCRTTSANGVYAPTDLYDLRCWGGSGGLAVAQQQFLTSHDLVPGQKWTVNGTSLSYIVNSSGSLQLDSVRRFAEPAQTGSGSLAANTTATIASVSVPDPGVSYHLEISATLETTTPVAGLTGFIQGTYDSTTWDTNRIGDSAYGLGANTSVDTVFNLPEQRTTSAITGARTVRLLCKANTSSITVGTVNYAFNVRMVPAVL